MPIDLTPFPQLPAGAKAQPTADPDVAYVYVDEEGSGRRVEIGMIRGGVFTPTAPTAAADGAVPAAPSVTPDPPPPPRDRVAEPPPLAPSFQADADVAADVAPFAIFYATLFFSFLAGGATPKDAGAYYRTHRSFLAALTGLSCAALPEDLPAEVVRRFLGCLAPAQVSQTLMQVLLPHLTRRFEHEAPEEPTLFFDAARAVVRQTGTPTLPLPPGLNLAGSCAAMRKGAANARLLKAVLEAGGDWLVELGDDAADRLVADAAEGVISAAAGDEVLVRSTPLGDAVVLAANHLSKSLQKTLPGLAAGSLIRLQNHEKATVRFWATTLAATPASLAKALSLIAASQEDAVEFFFPHLGDGNAAAILNATVIKKVTLAVRRNDARRRRLAGLKLLTPSEAARFFADPEKALTSTAAFFALL